ncbi:hypothetical protein T440DRAFT_465701 [Plenodomus tracheiphilus IPT5]|uniref:Uncharacterized protein n=1 Tax=Plenodomus tracheiphilus IPT5 TaxID=1408161 RepID=A0A6A7BEX7_9PLEO|nr:hypothetical protein T440DRAFT_465701 [Plenodomus tracheiphilus IPT5]
MSASIVEAKSLSSLTALASNPPAYPRNPTHVKHEPLTLYIARVPGSKDVFLSPMKPREKVVTAEDIQSSLYFVHVEQPEDAQLLIPLDYQGSDYQEQPQTSPTRSVAPAIQRKAVAGTPGNAPARKPIPGTLAPINAFENRQNINAGQFSQRPRSLAPDYSPRRSFDSNQYRQENDRPRASPRRASENPDRIGTTLTLIRRDPASGSQWNVARIEDPNIFEISSSNDSMIKKKIGSPMYIEILNPGYSKFLHSDTSNSSPAFQSRNGDISGHPVHNSLPLPPSSRPQGESLSTASENTFRRRLWMEGTQYGSAAFGHRKNTSHDYNAPRPDSRGDHGRAGELGAGNMGSRPSPSFLQRQDQAYNTIQVSDRQTSFRGYVFSSPWNGRCEFVTGVGGGSLKVKHITPLQKFIDAVFIISVVPSCCSWPSRSAARCFDSQRVEVQSTQ